MNPTSRFHIYSPGSRSRTSVNEAHRALAGKREITVLFAGQFNDSTKVSKRPMRNSGILDHNFAASVFHSNASGAETNAQSNCLSVSTALNERRSSRNTICRPDKLPASHLRHVVKSFSDLTVRSQIVSASSHDVGGVLSDGVSCFAERIRYSCSTSDWFRTNLCMANLVCRIPSELFDQLRVSTLISIRRPTLCGVLLI